VPQRAALRQTAKFFRQILGVIADPLQRLRREKNVEILLAAWTIRFGQMPVKQGMAQTVHFRIGPQNALRMRYVALQES